MTDVDGVLVFDQQPSLVAQRGTTAADLGMFLLDGRPSAPHVETLQARSGVGLFVVEKPPGRSLIEEHNRRELFTINGRGAAGSSAYQIARSEGFVGTEEQWLASLLGPQGSPGPQGPAGSGTSYDLAYGFAAPTTLWGLDHGLGTVALDVLTFDQNGDPIEGNVRYPSPDRIEVDFYYPTAGIARVFR